MMHRALCILAVCAIWGSAWAKLPPPTPEEQAAAAQKKAQQAAQQDEQKKALEQAQDRIAERYRRTHPQPSAGEGQNDALPKTAGELPGDAGPHGGRAPSAEAHSAPAKK